MLDVAGQGGVSARFGGVGAWLARRNSAVFLRSRERGSEDAVVFLVIGGDGYFYPTGAVSCSHRQRPNRIWPTHRQWTAFL